MLRIVLRFLALVLVLFVALIGGLFLISGERLAKIAGDQITVALGREVRIADDLRPQIFPNLGVRTGAFSVAGSVGEDALVTGEGLSIGVDLPALFSRRVDVKEITLVSPTLTLVKGADGRTNWSEANQDFSDGGSSTGEASSHELSIGSLSIQNGTVSYRDETSGEEMLFENINLSASMTDASAPLTASFDFVTHGHPATGDVKVASLSRLLAGEMTGISIDAQISRNTVRFAGDLSSEGVLEGDLVAAFPSPDALVALSGGAATPLPTDILPIEISGALRVTPDAIGITGGSYRFGTNRLQGPATVAFGDVPSVRAQLSAGALDLSFLTAEEGSANADPSAAEGKGWSTDPIDASSLSLLNADIRLDATNIDLGATAMQNVSATVSIDDARAVANILQAEAFGGALVGQFVANNRNGLSVAGKMDGKTVAIQSLLTDIAGFDRMRGAGNTQLSFLGVGQTLDEIMRSLSGSGALDIGQGDITGFDLASLFGGSETAEAVGDRAVTIFQSLDASFTIENGVMKNDDLLMTAKLFEARGSGDIDLGRQYLNYVLRPSVFENAVTDGFSIPVRIRGPWSNLRIYPDLESVARDRLKVEEEKLRAEAEARMEAERKKAEEKADARLEKEKQKLEDKIGKELRKGLGSLFDR